MFLALIVHAGPGLLNIFFIVPHEQSIVGIKTSSERGVGLGTEAEVPLAESMSCVTQILHILR